MKASTWMVGLAAVFTVTGALGYESRPPAGDPKRVGEGERDPKLLALLEYRQAEIDRLKKDLLAKSDAVEYAEAGQLGIVRVLVQSDLSERQQRRVAATIIREAHRYGLDPLLVVALIRTESTFNNYAVSSVGAMGLMQVMPDTARWFSARRGLKMGKAKNLFDPELNVELGVAYFADLVSKFGAVDPALIAYNAGPAAARKILARAELRKKFLAGYPRKVVAEFHKLKAKQKKEMAQRSESDTSTPRG